jgi:hypothetical protein
MAEAQEHNLIPVSELKTRYGVSRQVIDDRIKNLGIAPCYVGKKRFLNESQLAALDAEHERIQKKKAGGSSVPPRSKLSVTPGNRDASDKPSDRVQPSNAPIVPVAESALDAPATPFGEERASVLNRDIQHTWQRAEARAVPAAIAEQEVFNYLLWTHDFQNPQNKEKVIQGIAESNARWAKQMQEAYDPKAFTESVMNYGRSRGSEKL